MGLDNPFLSKTNPLYQPLPTPNVANVGNMQVISNNPIVESKPTMNLNEKFKLPFKTIQRKNPTVVFNAPENQINPFSNKVVVEEMPTEKLSWWKKRTKIQKTLVITGSVLILTFIGLGIYSTTKSKK